MKLFQKNTYAWLAILLLFSQIAIASTAAQDAVPGDLALEELKNKTSGDAVVDSRVVADPKTGRVWEIRKNKSGDTQVVRTSKFKPWKPKRKLHKLAEILKMEPPKP